MGKKKKSAAKRRARANYKKQKKLKARSINLKNQNNVQFIERPALTDIEAPDGFRPISNSQAMLEYSQPLLDYVESGKVKDINDVLKISMAIWNYAVSIEKHDKEFVISKNDVVNQIRITIGMSKSEATDFFETMVQRKNYLLPSEIQPKIPLIMFIRKETHTLIREFNYHQLIFSKEPIPPDDEDKEMVNSIKEMDRYMTDGTDYDEWEDDYFAMEEKCQDRFCEWLIDKGLNDFSDQFSGNIQIYLDFVYRYMHDDIVLLHKIKLIYIDEFFSDFLLRKMWVKPDEYITWPPALKLFYAFLQEKEYLRDPKPIIKMFDSIEPYFLEVLRKRYQ